MKASHWTAGLAAAITLTVGGASIAEVGLMDGKDPFTHFQSSKTRSEVHQEYLDANAQGLLPRSGNAEYGGSDISSRDIGARGPAGSRYQSRTREEVLDELREYKRTHNPNDPKGLYFGE